MMMSQTGTNWACSFVAAVVGLCCVGGSVYLFVESSHNTREQLVHSYDSVVDYWTARGRNQFANVSCVIANLTGSASFPLEARTKDAEHLGDSSGDLHSYTPLLYGRTGSITPGLQWNAAGKMQFDITLTCSGGAAPQVSTLVVPQVVMYFTDTDPMANPKQCMYQRKGSFINGHCEIYHKVKEICIKVGVYGGKWQLNNTCGGHGCHKAKNWSPVSYEWVAGYMRSFGHGLPPRGDVGLDQLQVLVRSGLDPMLEAEELTNDSLDFGASQRDQVIIGIVLLALGVCLLIPLAYRQYEATHITKDRKDRALANMVALEEEQFVNPLQDEGGHGSGIPLERYPSQSSTRGLRSTFGGGL